MASVSASAGASFGERSELRQWAPGEQPAGHSLTYARGLVYKFNIHDFFQPRFYPTSFFYLGMLTLLDDFSLTLPNINMRKIFVEYFNEFNQIDVTTRYRTIVSTSVSC